MGRGSNPCGAEKVLFGTQQDQTSSMVVMEVLGTQEPQEEVAESEPTNVTEGWINVPFNVVKDEDQEDNQDNN